jgi:hypothetical protein
LIAIARWDPEAIAIAHREGRLLLTEDKDFGELVFRWNFEGFRMTAPCDTTRSRPLPRPLRQVLASVSVQTKRLEAVFAASTASNIWDRDVGPAVALGKV